MKLPRWLSPVRTVEAETGWPRALCDDISRRIMRRSEWWDVPWALGMILIGGPLVVLAGLFVVDALPARASLDWALQVAAAALLIAVCAASVIAYSGVLLAWKSRRFLRRYLPAPWCFNCRYPVPPPIDGRLCEICPECGEPIPPEIAALAAERG